MKKLIALLLCTISSYSFGWDLDFLKPNFGTLSQSWTSLSAIQQTMILAASTLSFFGITYVAWPISKQSARNRVEKKLSEYRYQIEFQNALSKTPLEIKKLFNCNQTNPIRFPFGPFWNRNEFHVFIDTFEHEIKQTREIKTLITLNLIDTKTKKSNRFEYDPKNYAWGCCCALP